MEVKPLDIELCDRFDVVDAQKESWADFYNLVSQVQHWPPHMACILKNDVPVFIVGAVQIDDDRYDSFNYFGKECRANHLPMIVNYVKNYLSNLNAVEILHRVGACDKSMQRLCRMMGFKQGDMVDDKYTYVRS